MISDSTATYTNHEELASALDSLKPIVQSIAEPQRETIDKALQLLMQATHDSSISAEHVSEAAKTISTISPTMSDKLKEIAGKIAISLTSSTIVLGIRMGLGLP
jgi:hypothetical protein